MAFFDAGDYIENDLFESLLPYMEKNIHFIDFPYFVQTNYDCRYPVINKCEKNKVFSKDYIDKEILPIYLNIRENMNNLALNFVWRIIYLKKIIDDNNILFDESVRKWEDREFIIEYLDYCNSLVFTDKPMYTYICEDTQDHLATKYYSTLLTECIDKISKREILFKESYNFNGNYYISYIINVFIDRLIEMSNNESQKSLYNHLDNFVNDDFVISIFLRYRGDDKRIKKTKKYVLQKDIKSLLVQIEKINAMKNKKSLKSILILFYQKYKNKLYNIKNKFTKI